MTDRADMIDSSVELTVFSVAIPWMGNDKDSTLLKERLKNHLSSRTEAFVFGFGND